MDDVCRAIFEKVKSACAGGAAVFDAGELAGAVEGEELSAEKVDGAVKKLCGDGFLDIKYARGNLYCLAPVREPEDEDTESNSPATIVEVKQKFSLKCALLYCAAALVGGAAGSAIASVIAAVI